MRLTVLICMFLSLIIVFGFWTVSSKAVQQSPFINGPVELNSIEEFATKRDALSEATGFNLVLLGDSLGVGRAMAKVYPANWQEHTLDRALAGCLTAYLGNRKINV